LSAQYIANVEFDPAKDVANIGKHGISLAAAAEFDFGTGLFEIDDRFNYGETRIYGLGLIDGRVHALVFKQTDNGIRAISLRKANRREVKRYEQETQEHAGR
jgi:uncharacterized DUF497 family protein